MVIRGNFKALSLTKIEDNFSELQVFKFLNEVFFYLFEQYTEMRLEKAANFSLREFVTVLRDEMNNFKLKIEKRKKKKKKVNSTNFSFNSNDLSQTFIDKSIGNYCFYIVLYLFL